MPKFSELIHKNCFPVLVLISLLLSACGGVKKQKTITAHDYLLKGQCNKVFEAAQIDGKDKPENRAAIAVCQILNSDTKEALKKTEKILTENSDKKTKFKSALLTLTFAQEPEIETDTYSALQLAKASLTAAGLIGMDKWILEDSGDYIEISLLALELTTKGIYKKSSTFDMKVLSEILKACDVMLKDGVNFDSDYTAWRLYHVLARLLLILDKTNPEHVITTSVKNILVDVVESNPTIALAVRCDYSSPFENLRTVLFRDLKLIRRLEKTISEVSGCKMGTWAPMPD